MLSVRRATWSGPWRRPSHRHFYPRPPRGGRREMRELKTEDYQFLSTPSARRATRRPQRIPRRGDISIHALREEGDVRGLLRPSLHRSISIHALREEGAPAGCTASCPVWNFYPRPPPGGRPRPATAPGRPCDFYPRPPRGGRRKTGTRPARRFYFYPRPP